MARKADVLDDDAVGTGPPSVAPRLQAAGGLAPGVARAVSRASGVPEASVFGVASFFHLLSDPQVELRLCGGLSCRLAGAEGLLERAGALGLEAEACSCLAACDRAPAALRAREVLPALDPAGLERLVADLRGNAAAASHQGQAGWGIVEPAAASTEEWAIGLAGERDESGSALRRAEEMGAEALLAMLEESGLQGRGGAGFAAHAKWRAVREQAATPHYVVLNGDEGEPGTFKDRELMLRRPDRVIEGLAIAARVVRAEEVHLYLRGEFERSRRALEECLAGFAARGSLAGLHFKLHAGHGAYVCGEETALFEAIEGRRGLPRRKPPYPAEVGLFGQPTLIHNVETIACVPTIVQRGGAWFRALGRGEAGSKLYCVSGHVQRPGVYELPLGVCLDELVEAAGGYRGELKAFSPGGASSGFLPACERRRPLDFGSLAALGSALGSAGVVVLNQSVDMRWAALQQLRFFEAESCGQCAPCRIGTRYLREALEGELFEAPAAARPVVLEEVAWQMREGSICGLGQTAPLPLMSALRYFPEEFLR